MLQEATGFKEKAYDTEVKKAVSSIKGRIIPPFVCHGKKQSVLTL